MKQTLNEQECELYFKEQFTFYTTILEKLHLGALYQATDKVFANDYFRQHIETELAFQVGFPFVAKIIESFNLYRKLGLSWYKLLKEISIQQKIYTYKPKESSIQELAVIYNEFTINEIRRVELESSLLNVKNDEMKTSIYNFLKCNLLFMQRDIDFIRFFAKYLTLNEYLNKMKTDTNIDKNNVRGDNENDNSTIRWNGNKGKKIELIRLLVALNDCKYFETSEGRVPSQEQLMNYFGELLSVNLQHYEQDLSNGLESRLNTNTALFDKLKSAIEKRFNQKVEQK